jgi:hypothetical protein
VLIGRNVILLCKGSKLNNKWAKYGKEYHNLMQNFIKLHHLATKRTLITYIIKVSFSLTAVASSQQVTLLKI